MWYTISLTHRVLDLPFMVILLLVARKHLVQLARELLFFLLVGLVLFEESTTIASDPVLVSKGGIRTVSRIRF